MYKRAILSFRFVFCSLMVFGLSIISEFSAINYRDDIWNIVDLSFTGTFSTVIIVLAANTFSHIFCKDAESKYLRYSITRLGHKRYAFQCCSSTYISALLCFVLGSVLFCIFCFFSGCPLISFQPKEIGQVLDVFLTNNNPVAFIAFKILIRGSWAGLISVISLVISTFTTNSPITMIYPFIVYYSLFYISEFFQISRNLNFYYYINVWTNIVNMPFTLIASFTIPTVLSVLATGVFSYNVRRSDLL